MIRSPVSCRSRLRVLGGERRHQDAIHRRQAAKTVQLAGGDPIDRDLYQVGLRQLPQPSRR